MSDAMLALGAGLQSFGRGWMDLNQNREDTRRFDSEQKRREAEAEEQRRFRAEQSEFARAQQRDLRRSRRRAELQDYWARQGVVIDPDRLNALIDAEEQAEQANVPDAPVEGPMGRGTLPGGVDPFAAPDAASRPRPVDAMAEIARRALEGSRMQQGARVQLDDNWGFAQDENALRAAQAAELERQRQAAAEERAAADRAMRETIARITAGNRGGSGVSNLNALINDQEQVVSGMERTRPERVGPAATAARVPSLLDNPMFAAADSAFRADSTTFEGRLRPERSRLDALKILRGDSRLFESQGANPLSVPPAERGGVSGIGVRVQPPDQPASVPFTPTGANVPGAAAIARADAKGPNAPPGTMDRMVAAATGATTATGTSRGPSGGNPREAELAQQAQQAIARIMALGIPDAEKQARIRQVNERLATLVRSSR